MKIIRLQHLLKWRLRIKNDKTPDTLGNVPTLDFLNDLFQDDKINSAQYEALIRFMSNPEDLNNDQVLEEIRAQMFAAETVDDVDRLKQNCKFRRRGFQGLGINDYKTIGALIEKNKDRKGFEQYKYYGTLIDKILGKVDNVALRDGTDTVKTRSFI